MDGVHIFINIQWVRINQRLFWQHLFFCSVRWSDYEREKRIFLSVVWLTPEKSIDFLLLLLLLIDFELSSYWDCSIAQHVLSFTDRGHYKKVHPFNPRSTYFVIHTNYDRQLEKQRKTQLFIGETAVFTHEMPVLWALEYVTIWRLIIVGWLYGF